MASNVDKLNEQVDAIMKKAIEKNGGDLVTSHTRAQAEEALGTAVGCRKTI